MVQSCNFWDRYFDCYQNYNPGKIPVKITGYR